jgi:hypothetical protein
MEPWLVRALHRRWPKLETGQVAPLLDGVDVANSGRAPTSLGIEGSTMLTGSSF